MCCNNVQKQQNYPSKKKEQRSQKAEKLQKARYQEQRQRSTNKNNLVEQMKSQFKSRLQIDLKDNNKKVKDMIERLQRARDLEELELIVFDRTIAYNQVYTFLKSEERFAQQKTDVIVQLLSQISYLYFSAHSTHRKLIFALAFYLKQAIQIIDKGYSESDAQSFQQKKNTLKQISNELLEQCQQLISLAKQRCTKQSPKIQEEMKQRMGQKMQYLILEKERYQNENKILKEQMIHELKGIKQIKETLALVQNNLSSKQDINRLCKLLENNGIIMPKEEINQTIQQKDQTIQKLRQKIAQMEQQKSLLSLKLQQQIQAKNTQIKRISESYSKVGEVKDSQIKRLYIQIRDLQEENTKYKDKKTNLEEEIKRMSSTAQNSLKSTHNNQSMKDQIQRQAQMFQSQIEELKLKMNEVELAASKAQSQKFDLEDQIKRLTDDIKQKQRTIMKLQKEILQLSHKNKILQQEGSKLSEQVNEQKQLSKLLQKKIDQIPEDKSRVRSVSFVKNMILFVGSILQNRKGEKRFLTDTIEKHMGLQIDKTQKIYDYKRDNATNFHKYVNGHSNIVLIVETQKALLACYYSGKYDEGIQMTEEGLIISLDSRKCYKLNNFRNYPNKDPRDQRIIRGMVYDDYYIIFGNAEVRIRTGQNNIFSNFGISNSYFNSERDKVSSLLRDGNNNQVKFDNYEIHELFFNLDYSLQRIQ